MQVREIMTTRIIGVQSAATVREAARLMEENNIGSVPVLEGGCLSGMLTDRDIVLRCVAQGRDADSLRVSDVCSHGAVSVRPGDSVAQAVNVMAEEQVRRLPVVDGGRLVGMLSFADVARGGAGMELSGPIAEAITDISMP